MSLLGLAESVSVLVAPEAALPPSNVQPTSGWLQIEPDPGGITGSTAKVKTAARSPLSQNRQVEAGDVVDLDAQPQLTGDLTKELVDYFLPGIFESLEKFVGGGTGATANKFRPTAVTASQFTHPAITNALVTSTLIYARGFTNAANNGLFVVQTASTTTATKVTGTVVEASPPANATIEIVGFQCASGDLTSTATTLGATALDFTTLKLTPYASWIWVGGGTASSPGALGFASATNRGFVRVTAVSATTLTFDSALLAGVPTTWGVDAGAAKTIQIFFGSCARDVAIGSADYQEVSYALEFALPKIGSAGATDYSYAAGAYVDTFEVNVPSENLCKCTLSLSGTDIAVPTTVRATGASTAIQPLATAAFNSTSGVLFARVSKVSDNSAVSVDIDTWKLTKKNNIKGQKQQGKLGPNRLIVGKSETMVDLGVFATQDDAFAALRNNTPLRFTGALKNNDGALLFDCPNGRLSKADPSFPANDAIMIAETFVGNRDVAGGNFTLGVNKYPYLPAS